MGTRVTLYQCGPWSVGGLVQGTWFRPGDSHFRVDDPLIPDESWDGDVKLSYWQAQASLAVAYQVGKGLEWLDRNPLRFWAGPFIQFTQGDMDFEGRAELAGNTGTLNWSSTMDDSFQVGGHFGANWQICDPFDFWVEGQITGDSWLVSAGAVILPQKAFKI